MITIKIVECVNPKIVLYVYTITMIFKLCTLFKSKNKGFIDVIMINSKFADGNMIHSKFKSVTCKVPGKSHTKICDGL